MIYQNLIYIIIVIILVYTLYIIYFKSKSKFWSIQPVFHIHNIKYWLKPPGIINKNLFPINKYYDMNNLIFKRMNDATPLEFDRFCEFIKKHYLRIKNNIEYLPTREKTNAYFENHNNNCYLAYIKSNKYLLDNKKEINTIVKYDSVITSRPLNVYIDTSNFSLFNINNSNKKEKIVVNYVDYLCTNKEKRNKGLAPRLIYTYAINSQLNNKSINIYLFKRESESTQIVPITIYNSYLYNISSLIKNVNLLPYKLVRITSSNIHLLYDNLIDKYNESLLEKQYKLIILPSYENLKVLIDKECFYIYILQMDEIVYDIYIFRNSEVIYNNCKTIDFIASNSFYKNRMKDKDLINEIFYNGFCECIKEIKKEGFEKLLFENISDNTIIKQMCKNRVYINKTTFSYYFYNFAMIPLYSKDCFILQ
jgi:hypothetical protein